jgi:aromatic ring-cleaving dioxygenase
MADPLDPEIIVDYHAHVYFDPASRDVAAKLRQWVEDRFIVRMGRWHDVPVGPHPQAMYQIAFGVEIFPALVPFLMLNRQGLNILVHPDTDRPRDDHVLRAAWLGEKLLLKAEVLPETS